MSNLFLSSYDNTAKKIRERIVSVSSGSIAPSPSEKVAREEIRKLTQNTEEIRKIKEKIEKKESTNK